MDRGPTYEELEKRVHTLEMEAMERRRAEKALKQSEAALASIFTAAPIGIGLVTNRVLKQANDRMCSMLGYASDELIGNSARILYPSDEEFERVGTEKYAQIRERGTGTIETRWKCKDGRVIDVLLSSTPLDRSDLSAGVTFTALDITERKRAEEALRESEARYRALFENMSNGVAIYKAQNEGEDFVFVGFNKGAEKIESVKRESLIGRSVIGVFPGIKDFGLLEVLQRVWKTGKPEDHPVSLYKDDRIAGWRDNFVYKLPSGEVVAVYSDETERKRAEQALKKSHDELELKVKERTAALVEANDRLRREIEIRKQAESVLRKRTHDLGERVKELNCLYRISHLVEKRGNSLEDILQGAVDIVIQSWQYAEVACARIIFEGQQFVTENFKETAWKQASDIFVHGQRNGVLEICYLEQRPQADEGPFLKEERNLINAIAGRLGGIAELVRAEEALQDKEERLRQDQKRMELLTFANDVALNLMHELRNPLVTIGGYSRRISTRDYPGEKLKEYGKIIFEQSVRLDNALNEALVHLKSAAEQV